MARPRLKNPATTAVTTALPWNDTQALEAIAERENKGRSTIVRRAVRLYLESLEKAASAA